MKPTMINHSNDDLRDIAIRVTDHLVKQGVVKDCTDTDSEDEFIVQDAIHDALKDVKFKREHYPEALRLSDYYEKKYPEDELSDSINLWASFQGLDNVLQAGGDVYEYIGVADSLVRERLFIRLAELKKVDYDVIYTDWLGRC